MLRIMTTISAVQVTITVIYLVRTKIISLLVGPEGYGIISVIDQAVQWMTYLSTLSLPVIALKWMAQAVDEGTASVRATYGALVRIVWIFAGTGCTVGLIVTLGHASVLPAALRPYRGLLALALLSVPAFALQQFCTNVLAGMQRFYASLWVSFGVAVGLAVAAPVGILLGRLTGLYIANGLIATGIIVAVLTLLHRRYGLSWGRSEGGIRVFLRRNPRVARFVGVDFLRLTLYPFSYLVVRYLTLAHHGAASAGYLHADLAIADSLTVVLGLANSLYLMAILNRKSSIEVKARAVLDFQERLAVGLGILAMPLVLFPETVLTVLFSRSFLPAGADLFLFVMAQCIMLWTGVYQSFLVALDDYGVYGMLVTIGHLSRALLAYPLIRMYGIRGAGVAFLIAALLMLVIGGIRMHTLRVLYGRYRPHLLMGYVVLGTGCMGALRNAGVDTILPGPLSSGLVYGLFLIGMIGLWTATRSR